MRTPAPLAGRSSSPLFAAATAPAGMLKASDMDRLVAHMNSSLAGRRLAFLGADESQPWTSVTNSPARYQRCWSTPLLKRSSGGWDDESWPAYYRAGTLAAGPRA